MKCKNYKEKMRRTDRFDLFIFFNYYEVLEEYLTAGSHVYHDFIHWKNCQHDVSCDLLIRHFMKQDISLKKK